MAKNNNPQNKQQVKEEEKKNKQQPNLKVNEQVDDKESKQEAPQGNDKENTPKDENKDINVNQTVSNTVNDEEKNSITPSIEKETSDGERELKLLIEQFTTLNKSTDIITKENRLYGIIDGINLLYPKDRCTKDDILNIFKDVVGKDKPLNSVVVGMLTFDWKFDDDVTDAIQTFVNIIEHINKDSLSDIDRESVANMFRGKYFDLGQKIIIDFFS